MALSKMGLDVTDYLPPELPQEMKSIFHWFSEMSVGRQSGMGMNALSSMEILAWCQLRGMKLGSFELKCIRELDGLLLKRANDANE
jgi:hypothetical protein